MGREEKLALQNLVYDQLIRHIKIPRGYTKSIAGLYANLYHQSIKRTNYILAAIDESL